MKMITRANTDSLVRSWNSSTHRSIAFNDDYLGLSRAFSLEAKFSCKNGYYYDGRSWSICWKINSNEDYSSKYWSSK
jgi:hypothetical protein